mmetsp:Transcript_10271/g.18145  ORF Transcript_10271/g.18145 Transcript_10271/m.18145 type:complete len:211 (-) Transcript_10271:392-1024(-)
MKTIRCRQERMPRHSAAVLSSRLVRAAGPRLRPSSLPRNSSICPAASDMVFFSVWLSTESALRPNMICVSSNFWTRKHLRHCRVIQTEAMKHVSHKVCHRSSFCVITSRCSTMRAMYMDSVTLQHTIVRAVFKRVAIIITGSICTIANKMSIVSTWFACSNRTVSSMTPRATESPAKDGPAVSLIFVIACSAAVTLTRWTHIIVQPIASR